MTVPAPVTSVPASPSWLSNIAAPLVEIGKAILNALANFNWSTIFPSFAGLASALVALLQTLLGIVSTKVAPVPAAS